jgi:hypothetical protein
MASFGKLAMALGSAHNENTLALANLNFDFSLFRVEAPEEFKALGKSLSAQRRREAEIGSPHRLSRKLGALFEQILPHTPDLVKAYGTRVSEISQMAAVNPKGRDIDGPFAEHMGADGTAIWAAATSGPSAIPVLMLACMLARMWKAAEAISIWAEIIEQRKKQISEDCHGDKGSDFATIQAMHQEFTRPQLAEWDASIRAWLQSADEAKSFQQTQLTLIINNVNLPVSNNSFVFQSVVDSWTTAMVAMDGLIKGGSQRDPNGALLLGLAAWHLYPDIIVHGSSTKTISMKDPLIHPGGKLTLGLENLHDNHVGVCWSLPLAHLMYYGDPVLSRRSISQDSSRVSIDQFVYFALGAVLSSWELQPSQTLDAIQWFVGIHRWLNLNDLATTESKSPQTLQLHEQRSLDKSTTWLLRSSHWFRLFMDTSLAILEAKQEEQDQALKLVAFGKRKGVHFMAGGLKYHPASFFGLSSPATLLPIVRSEEYRITLLRKIANELGANGKCGNSFIIRYLHHDDDSDEERYEYASVLPQDHISLKRQRSGEQRSKTQHKRWISIRRKDEGLKPRDPKAPPCQCENTHNQKNSPHGSKTGGNGSIPDAEYLCVNGCPCAKFVEGCMEECHSDAQKHFCEVNEDISSRWAAVKERGDEISSINEACSMQNLLRFTNIISSRDSDQPKVSTEKLFTDTWAQVSGRRITIALEDAPWDTTSRGNITIREVNFFYGDMETAAIYRVGPGMYLADESNVSVNIEQLKAGFQDGLDLKRLLKHFQRMHSTYDKYMTSLNAIAAAADIYKILPSATIDLGVVLQPFCNSHWAISAHARQDIVHEQISTIHLDRAETFACIAMFESGSLNAAPESLSAVMAMSTGNSIFVAAPLLCDPAEAPLPHEIRRVVGNIGRAGINMLIPPQNPKTVKLKPETWSLINHSKFDGKIEDSFQATSLHLSFTPYVLPLNIGDHGTQDKDVFFVESLVSVYDHSKWIADLDILKSFESHLFSRVQRAYNCNHCCNCQNTGSCEHSNRVASSLKLTSLDNWEELIERDRVNCIVRANGNWLARLATNVLSISQGHKTAVVSNPICWECINSQHHKATTYIC